MTGKELKTILLRHGFEQKKVAALIGITPQDMVSKLKAQSIKTEFLEKIGKVINSSVSQLLKEAEMLRKGTLTLPATQVIKEPEAPYEKPDITRLLIELISKQTALIERQGLKDEQQQAKDEKLIQTADTAITLANEVRAEIKGLSSSVSHLQGKIEENGDALTALQVWASETLAPVVKKNATQVIAELLRIQKEAQQQRIADSQPSLDKPRRVRVKSHQS